MKKLIGFICVLLLSFFAVRPLFSPGYFPMHDDTQVARVVVMGKALRQGQFPVRWVSDLGYGYGYPLFNFYAPLPYYIGGGLYAFGVDNVVATKMMFAIGMVIAPLALFLFVQPSFGVLAAVTASVLFLYAPYHAVEAYIRGSVGEYWAIAFVPLLLYGLQLSFQKKRQVTGIILGSLSLGAVIISHTILGFVTCFLLGGGLVIYWIMQLTQKKLSVSSITYPGILMLLGLGLSSFFWLPALFELSATSVSSMVTNASTSFFDHFVCVGQLWNSPWGYGGSAPGCIDGMSFKFGKWQITTALFAMIMWAVFQKRSLLQEKNKLMIGSMLGLVVCTILTLQISSPFWHILPFTSFIQYPWRLLSFCMMFLAICGAYVVALPRRPIVRIGLMIGIVVVTIMVNAKIFVPQYTYMRDSYAFETIEELRFTRSKISDEYLPQGLVKPQQSTDIVKTALQGNNVFFVRALKETDISLYAELESPTSQEIIIRKAWFPGWKIKVNGTLITPTLIQGVPTVNIQAGMSIIQMQFTDTPIRLLGNILSGCSVILIGAIYLYGKKTNA